jgi:hypothetical protein
MAPRFHLNAENVPERIEVTANYCKIGRATGLAAPLQNRTMHFALVHDDWGDPFDNALSTFHTLHFAHQHFYIHHGQYCTCVHVYEDGCVCVCVFGHFYTAS